MPSGQLRRNKKQKTKNEKKETQKKIRVKVISLVSYSRIKRQDCPMSAITQVVPRAQYKHQDSKLLAQFKPFHVVVGTIFSDVILGQKFVMIF